MALDGRVLSNVSVLAAVVKGGSFVRAAEALGLTPSGVSRAIARLEARIGVRLLDRTTRSLHLTDEGRLLYANINPLVLGIEDAVTRTAGSAGSVRGRLRDPRPRRTQATASSSVRRAPSSQAAAKASSPSAA